MIHCVLCLLQIQCTPICQQRACVVCAVFMQCDVCRIRNFCQWNDRDHCHLEQWSLPATPILQTPLLLDTRNEEAVHRQLVLYLCRYVVILLFLYWYRVSQKHPPSYFFNNSEKLSNFNIFQCTASWRHTHTPFNGHLSRWSWDSQLPH